MHKDDQMTPRERMAAFVTGKPMDRYPTMPFVGTVAAKVGGFTQRERRQSAANMAKSQVDSYQRFGNDSVSVGYGLNSLGEALGSKLNDPEDAVPAIMDHILKSLDDVDRIDWEKAAPERDEKLKMQLDTSELILEAVGDEIGCGATVSGPFTAASGIYKIDNMLRDMRRNPEGLHKLLRRSTDIVKEVAAIFVKRGMGISLADPVASGTIIRPDQYEEFVKPYTIEFIEHVHSLGGALTYHICGQTIKIVEHMVDTGPNMLSLDNVVDLKKARELVGDRICIIGNVDPVGIMMIGTQEDVEADVKRCFRDMYDSPKGYLLATGCDLPTGVPLENIDAFMAAARKYGKYPYNPELFS